MIGKLYWWSDARNCPRMSPAIARSATPVSGRCRMKSSLFVRHPCFARRPVRGPGVADESADIEPWAVVDDVDETVVNDGDFEPDGEVDADDELDERPTDPCGP